MEPQTTLIRAKILPAEYVEIRKEALDRGLHVGEYVAQLLRAGRECIGPMADSQKETS